MTVGGVTILGKPLYSQEEDFFELAGDSTMPEAPLIETDLSGFPRKRGKVRDVYDLGDELLIISTDRISAFDWVLPTGIPDKGRVLTQVSNFWFEYLGIDNHLLETDVQAMDLPKEIDLEPLVGRTVLARKAQVVPIECVVRGYLAGSAWEEYRNYGRMSGIELPTGMRESDRLPAMIFSPATKAEQGEHDENITFTQMCERVGNDLSEQLRHHSLEIYQRGASYALEQGIIVADKVRIRPVRWTSDFG